MAKIPAALQRYGLATLSVAIALGVALSLERYHFRNVADPLFLMAIATSVWYAGVGPGALAVVLSGLANSYFFIEPIYSIYVTRQDLPHFIIFILFASLLTGFAGVRRHFEQELLRSRDELKKEVLVRTQQASLLNLTHDTIFVRNMNDRITYWNRGAQEMYGWTAEQAVGKRSHDLLHTVFPAAIEQIQAELLSADRWEGELEHTKADGTGVVVASRWSLQRNEQDNPVAILETNNDITHRRRGEEEVRKLNQELGKRTIELEAINKGQASSCRDAIQKFRELQPDITLMDLRLPDMDGIDALIAFQTQFPEARIIVMTTFEGDGPVQRALQAGAWSYVRKNMSPREITDAIRQVHAGKKRAPAVVAANSAEPLHEEGLTDYEADVLRHTAGGNRNRGIAAKALHHGRNDESPTVDSISRGASKLFF